MRHETTWKPRSVGAATAASRGLERTGLWAFRDCPQSGHHPTKRVSLGAAVSPTRRTGFGCQTGAGTSAEAECPAAARTGAMPAEGSCRLRVLHRFVDLPAHRPVDRATLRRALPCRRHLAPDGFARFFPLRSPSVEQSNGMKRRSAGGSNTTGPASSAWRSAGKPIWFSLMRRAFCCTRWFDELGRPAGRRRCCGNELDTTAGSRRSADCPSRRDVVGWDGICGSTRTRAFGKSRSSSSCVTCCDTCRTLLSWCGTIWEPTRAGRCASGCLGVGVCTWSTCRAMLRNSIPTSTAGRTSRATRWPTTARKMLTNCTGEWSPWLTKWPISNRCFARSFMRLAYLSDSSDEHLFYRYQ